MKWPWRRFSSEFDPDWCIRPGITIRHCMEDLGQTPAEAAGAMFITEELMNGLLDGSVEIITWTAERLAGWAGGSPEFWLAREEQYRDGLRAGKKDVSDG